MFCTDSLSIVKQLMWVIWVKLWVYDSPGGGVTSQLEHTVCESHQIDDRVRLNHYANPVSKCVYRDIHWVPYRAQAHHPWICHTHIQCIGTSSSERCIHRNIIYSSLSFYCSRDCWLARELLPCLPGLGIMWMSGKTNWSSGHAIMGPGRRTFHLTVWDWPLVCITMGRWS